MTTQTLNKYCMQSNCNDMDFLSRWLHGRLTPEELASMRNRKDYEEMMEEMEGNGNSTLTIEAEDPANETTEQTEDSTAKRDSFLKLVAVPTIFGAAGWLVFKSLTQIL